MRGDEARLFDMLLAARRAMEFAASSTFPQFEQDDMHQLAILKAVEIIGEAATRLSVGAREAQPHIPWHKIIGMRNRIVHVYYDIDLSVVWQTVQEDLPALIAQLEPLVPSEAG